MINQIPLISLNGDAWCTPESTLDAFCSALGGGAASLAMSVHLSQDKQLLCAPSHTLLSENGPIRVPDSTWCTVQSIDAGAEFRSTELDSQGQPNGNRGDDQPWRQKNADGRLKKREAVRYQTLEHLLYVFARRVPIFLLLSECDSKPLVELTLELLSRTGLAARVTLIANDAQLKQIRRLSPQTKTCLDLRSGQVDSDTIGRLKSKKVHQYLALLEQVVALPKKDRAEIARASAKRGCTWLLSSQEMPYAPCSKDLHSVVKCKLPIAGYLSRGTLPSMQILRPQTTVFSDTFAGNALDTRYWRAGHSHVSRESRISVDKGLIVELLEGSEYAGAGAAITTAIHGDFDAQVDFHVANPHQATTFELAAIGIDPGYHHMSEDGLNTRTVNLTFDVHGAPPYASSERDQNDGFRCGWNNCSNLTQVASDFKAASVNMYNKYGRDVGDGSIKNPQGQLRLIRHGPYFSTYYRDAHNRAWVNSGSMLVAALPEHCFVRLAAKHWAKLSPKPSPANKVVFKNFVLRQY